MELINEWFEIAIKNKCVAYTWYHVVVVYDNIDTEQKFKMYLNGSLVK